MTIQEKWTHVVGQKISYHTIEYLQEKFPVEISAKKLVKKSKLVAQN
jgi:hypothetical protein